MLQACNILPREQWCQLEVEQGIGPLLQWGKSNWPYAIALELGMYLVDLMVKNLKINSDILKPAPGRKLIPILYHIYTFRSTLQVLLVSTSLYTCSLGNFPQGYNCKLVFIRAGARHDSCLHISVKATSRLF